VASCKNRGGSPGVDVEAASEAAGKLVCTIGNRRDVRHSVTVTNLRLYPATLVQCDGEITSNPRKVRFGGTPNQWTANTTHLPPKHPYDFDTEPLLRDAGGTEAVHAEVTVTWKRPGRAGNARVTIDVTG
jgi:hypothetical protein